MGECVGVSAWMGLELCGCVGDTEFVRVYVGVGKWVLVRVSVWVKVWFNMSILNNANLACAD